MAFDQFPRMMSQPHPVCWAGFQSDTRTLQQNGWEFAAHQDAAHYRFGLMMKHSALGIHACTNLVDYTTRTAGMLHPDARQAFYIQWLTDRNLRVQDVRPPDWMWEAKPVDMQPQVVRELVTLDDLNLFAGCMARTNEIIVDPHSVPDMMDRILELQEPARQEYFRQQAAEMRRRNQDPGIEAAAKSSPRQNFHAQIVSLVA